MTLSPYFQSLAAQVRICPQCHSHAYLTETGTHNPNFAIVRCRDCTYIELLEAPKGARVPWDENHPWDDHTPSDFLPDLPTVYEMSKAARSERMQGARVISFEEAKAACGGKSGDGGE